MSPYLFIIVVEILALYIRQENSIEGIIIEDEEFKLSQYADDTGLTLLYSENTLRSLVNILREFGKISGLKVNYDKSMILPLGKIKQNYTILLPEINIKWTTEPIHTLGVYIGTNKTTLLNINYDPVKTKITNVMRLWRWRNLTLLGKILS